MCYVRGLFGAGVVRHVHRRIRLVASYSRARNIRFRVFYVFSSDFVTSLAVEWRDSGGATALAVRLGSGSCAFNFLYCVCLCFRVGAIVALGGRFIAAGGVRDYGCGLVIKHEVGPLFFDVYVTMECLFKKPRVCVGHLFCISIRRGLTLVWGGASIAGLTSYIRVVTCVGGHSTFLYYDFTRLVWTFLLGYRVTSYRGLVRCRCFAIGVNDGERNGLCVRAT